MRRFPSTVRPATGGARRRPSTTSAGCNCCPATTGTRSTAYQSSLKIFAEIGGAQNEAILYLNIGCVYDYKGSYEEALAAYRRALAIFREIGDLPNQADVLNDTGAIYRKAECYDEALIHHEQARLIAEEIGNQSQQVIALRGIADVCRASGPLQRGTRPVPRRAQAGQRDR